MKKTYEVDMTSGPVITKMVRMAVPLVLSGVLQLLFNAADMVVVGRFGGSGSLAAVGATTMLINLLINLFIGISVGTNIVVANYYGAGESQNIYETIHTAMLTALLCGLGMIAVGFVVSRPILTLMKTPADVLDSALLYIRIYFFGLPFLISYNFGAAILRAAGDTKRPLFFLSCSGAVNVLFNLFFVIVLKMDVAGVALATVIAQALSCSLVVQCMCRSEAFYRLNLRDLRIYPDKLKRILRVGVPAGLQSIMFNLANLFVQSSVNSFGSLVMAANTAAGNVDAILQITSASMQQTTLSFLSQNNGAGKYRRMDRILASGIVMITICELILGGFACLFGRSLLGLFTSDRQVVAYGMVRIALICGPYALASIMDMFAAGTRSIGYSLLPTLLSITGICGFRILWITLVFRPDPTLTKLYMVYPLSFILTGILQGTAFFLIRRKSYPTDRAQWGG